MVSTARQIDPPVSEADYFALERDTDIRHELLDGQVFAMVGGSFNHSRIVGNLFREISAHLKGKPCEVFSESTKLRFPSKLGGFNYVYPDVVVDCSTHLAEDNMLVTPVLIVEVLSRSTRRRDETVKRAAYRQIPTLMEYVLIEQDAVDVEVMRRGSGWLPGNYFMGDSLTLESVGVTLQVEEIYERVQNADVEEWVSQKQRPPFNEVMLSVPNVGEDEDFERHQASGKEDLA